MLQSSVRNHSLHKVLTKNKVSQFKIYSCLVRCDLLTGLEPIHVVIFHLGMCPLAILVI